MDHQRHGCYLGSVSVERVRTRLDVRADTHFLGHHASSRYCSGPEPDAYSCAHTHSRARVFPAERGRHEQELL